jgi:hypothetical protein
MNQGIEPKRVSDEPLSITKQIENCVLALHLWSEVTPRRVRLDTWHCGTHACFGGHLATWPEFRAQGVQRMNDDGEPIMHTKGGNTLWAGEVSQRLFGSDDLFCMANACRADFGMPVRTSDHKLVVNRLEEQIERLTQRLIDRKHASRK